VKPYKADRLMLSVGLLFYPSSWTQESSTYDVAEQNSPSLATERLPADRSR
jgi:hypothetical protein